MAHKAGPWLALGLGAAVGAVALWALKREDIQVGESARTPLEPGESFGFPHGPNEVVVRRRE